MSASAAVQIHHFTDPGCPFAFSAERQRLRLAWRYGDQIDWETHVIVLSEAVDPDSPFTTARLSEALRRLQERYGMPIDWSERPRMAATVPACRAVVAARLHAPERADALLRALRVTNFANRGLLDEPATLAHAAEAAGIAPDDLAAWLEDPAVETALREDMAAARSPSPAARAQDQRLGGPREERRYTCPSYEIVRTGDGARLDLPGFQPVESYEAALANLAPELDLRPDPEDAATVLAWAGMALATAEVAAVCARDASDVRTELAGIARFEPVGADGYWSLP